MAKLEKLEKVGDSPDYSFYCPGCNCDHGVWTTISNGNNCIWTFNGDVDKPTISPSILVNRGGLNPSTPVCHLFVTEGRIQYLGDCTHELAGQTIDMYDIDN